MNRNLAVYKLHFDCGRQGELTGLFVEEQCRVDALIESGIEVHFGEALGKHSEICGPVEACDITKVSDDPSVVKVILEHRLCTGYDPFTRMTSNSEDVIEAVDAWIAELNQELKGED